jgi:hypothetical protein
MDSVVVRDPEVERLLEGFPTVGREMALLAIDEAKESLLASH